MLMPYLLYLTHKDNFANRMFLHPERIIAAWWGILGLLLIFNLMFGRRRFAGTLEHFPWPFILGVALLFLVSGACIISAAMRPSNSDAWRYERLGWILGAGAWFTYGSAFLTLDDSPAFTSWSLPVALLALCFVRLKALGRTEATIRAKAGA